jgi:hypothetical protein
MDAEPPEQDRAMEPTMGPLTVLQMYAERMDLGVTQISIAAFLMAVNMFFAGELPQPFRTIAQDIGGAVALLILLALIVIQLFV